MWARESEGEREKNCLSSKERLSSLSPTFWYFMCWWKLTFVNFTSCTTLFLWDFLFFCSIDTVSLISYRSSLLFGKRRMVQNVPLRPFRTRFNPWWWRVLALMWSLLGGQEITWAFSLWSLLVFFIIMSISLWLFKTSAFEIKTFLLGKSWGQRL